jgi:SH3-like domain-containing protein
LFDEVVYDLKEQTQKMENIRFSAEESRKEPWVKVRTADGKVGWVFGAVVSFYRKPRPAAPMRDSSLTTGSDTTAAAPSTTPIPGRPSNQPPRNR